MEKQGKTSVEKGTERSTCMLTGGYFNIVGYGTVPPLKGPPVPGGNRLNDKVILTSHSVRLSSYQVETC